MLVFQAAMTSVPDKRGREEGDRAASKRMAVRMLEQNVVFKFIAKITGLTISEIDVPQAIHSCRNNHNPSLVATNQASPLRA